MLICGKKIQWINAVTQRMNQIFFRKKKKSMLELSVIKILPTLLSKMNLPHRPLHKKNSFELRISSVNVDLVTYSGEIFNGKLHFLCTSQYCRELPLELNISFSKYLYALFIQFDVARGIKQLFFKHCKKFKLN